MVAFCFTSRCEWSMTCEMATFSSSSEARTRSAGMSLLRSRSRFISWRSALAASLRVFSFSKSPAIAVTICFVPNRPSSPHSIDSARRRFPSV